MSQKNYELSFEICWQRLKNIYEDHIGQVAWIALGFYLRFLVRDNENKRWIVGWLRILQIDIKELIEMRLDVEILFIKLNRLMWS